MIDNQKNLKRWDELTTDEKTRVRIKSGKRGRLTRKEKIVLINQHFGEGKGPEVITK